MATKVTIRDTSSVRRGTQRPEPKRLGKKAVLKRFFSNPSKKVTARLEKLDALGGATDKLQADAKIRRHMIGELNALIKLGVATCRGLSLRVRTSTHSILGRGPLSLQIYG